MNTTTKQPKRLKLAGLLSKALGKNLNNQSQKTRLLSTTSTSFDSCDVFNCPLCQMPIEICRCNNV